MRHSLGSILGRVAAVIGGLLFIGLTARLVLAILAGVLPGQFSQALVAGWNLVYQAISSGVPALIAVVILCAIAWILVGNHRR